ncbi:MAG: hypothetical protein SGPRY_006648, partial [Prymnesium sp.]
MRLLERMEEQVIPLLGELYPQNHANLLWGFAKLGYTPSALLPEAEAALCVPGALARAKPVEIADMSLALGLMANKGEYGDLLRALASRATPDELLPSFTSRQGVILLWATARLDGASVLPEGLLDEWVSHVRRVHEETPLLARDMRNLERALGALGLDASWVSRSAMLNTWRDAADGLSGKPARAYSEEELRATFDAIDTDQSGDIDLNELSRAIKQVRPEVNEQTIRKMISLADEDGDLEVSFEEFKQIMSNL